MGLTSSENLTASKTRTYKTGTTDKMRERIYIPQRMIRESNHKVEALEVNSTSNNISKINTNISIITKMARLEAPASRESLNKHQWAGNKKSPLLDPDSIESLVILEAGLSSHWTKGSSRNRKNRFKKAWIRLRKYSLTRRTSSYWCHHVNRWKTLLGSRRRLLKGKISLRVQNNCRQDLR